MERCKRRSGRCVSVCEYNSVFRTLFFSSFQYPIRYQTIEILCVPANDHGKFDTTAFDGLFYLCSEQFLFSRKRMASATRFLLLGRIQTLSSIKILVISIVNIQSLNDTKYMGLQCTRDWFMQHASYEEPSRAPEKKKGKIYNSIKCYDWIFFSLNVCSHFSFVLFS